MQTVHVSSSDVLAVTYDETRQMMEVDFVKNGPYVYFNIPFEVYTSFLAAESKGRFVYKVLRNGPYPYNKGSMQDAIELTNWVPASDFDLTQ